MVYKLSVLEMYNLLMHNIIVRLPLQQFRLFSLLSIGEWGSLWDWSSRMQQCMNSCTMHLFSWVMFPSQSGEPRCINGQQLQIHTSIHGTFLHIHISLEDTHRHGNYTGNLDPHLFIIYPHLSCHDGLCVSFLEETRVEVGQLHHGMNANSAQVCIQLSQDFVHY